MVANNTGPKIQQEKATVSAMIYLYCHQNHHTPRNQLCNECHDLLNYAMARLTMCRFGEHKTTCERCPKHCYRKDYKQKIKQVMRYAGPRMIIHHPIMAFRHIYKNLLSR
ncbi:MULTISPECIES: nitrous oxide-stimulated promoter family protein [unclassified Gilliamella]|uniref:nitrous oxide-stimulated promoter family protein n=1 Tax=unclassified Gilliamella TaxID=2685620 RepID=UPI0013231FB2|nr:MULTISPECIES: nitrous oxide-stimulated promoter family protein [unclassified Gilliamella]MWN32666.1 nitrous oxide-stimulated promoter family protein [Gilliamella sp. Pra-s60]MWP30115.1 nitrous oxide-stimulated promoter family protein [Gilliamella sp. Pra-s54]